MNIHRLGKIFKTGRLERLDIRVDKIETIDKIAKTERRSGR